MKGADQDLPALRRQESANMERRDAPDQKLTGVVQSKRAHTEKRRPADQTPPALPGEDAFWHGGQCPLYAKNPLTRKNAIPLTKNRTTRSRASAPTRKNASLLTKNRTTHSRARALTRKNPKIKWKKDRGKEPELPKDQYPWFWGWDEETVDYTGGLTFDGNRWNDLHFTNEVKRTARQPARKGG